MQRHHYVPQFYLREWYVPGKSEFWLYCRDDAGRLLFGRKSARSIGYQGGLYSVMPEVLGVQSAISNEIEEKFFSPLDSAASRIHRRLLKCGPGGLADQDRLLWGMFVNSLLERTPERIDQVKRNAQKIAQKSVAELTERSAADGRDPKQVFAALDVSAITNNAVLAGMVRWISNIETVRYFADMRWVVIRLQEGNEHLLTGDSPVVINGASGGDPIHILSLALSPGALLIMHAPHEAFDEELIRKIALMHSVLVAEQTKRYLVSSRELRDDGFIKYRKVSVDVFTGSKRGK